MDVKFFVEFVMSSLNTQAIKIRGQPRKLFTQLSPNGDEGYIKPLSALDVQA